MPWATNRKEFMFFSSQRGRSSDDPSGRTETFASTRSVPFSISASEIPSSTIVWRRSCRKRRGGPGRGGRGRGGAGVLGRGGAGPGDDLAQRRPAGVEVDRGVVGAADPAGAAADVRRLR